MNTRSPFINKLLIPCSCLWLALNPALLAQGTRPAAERSATTGGFDIVIADGVLRHQGKETPATLESVIDMLRDRHPEANIVVAPEVPRIQFQSLKIRATDLAMELEALRVASGEQFAWGLAGGGVIDPATGLPASSSDQPLYVLRRAPDTGQGRLRVEAFSLGGYLASLQKSDDPKEDAKAIERAIDELEQVVNESVDIYRAIHREMHGGDVSRKTGLNLRFHRGANLVILIGDPESVEVAAKVIGALPHVQPSGAGMGFGDFGGGSGGYGAGGGRAGGYGMDPFTPPVYNPYGRPETGYGGAPQVPSADEPPRR